jgi:hypothetical protein
VIRAVPQEVQHARRQSLVHRLARYHRGNPTQYGAFERDDAGIPGFVAYYFIETDDGLATITVTEDETGTAESMGRAASWIEQHTPNHSPGEPEVIEGHTLISAIR